MGVVGVFVVVVMGVVFMFRCVFMCVSCLWLLVKCLFGVRCLVFVSVLWVVVVLFCFFSICVY